MTSAPKPRREWFSGTSLEGPTVSRRARTALLASIAITALLYLVPYGHWVAYPMMLLSTLFHELGHGTAAALMGGNFERFVMYPDGSGVAQWTGSLGRIDRALVSAGGLVGPAIVAAIAFLAARRRKAARIGLIVLACALGLAELFVVRNSFGVGFVAICIAALAGIAWLRSKAAAQFALVFLATQLALSVFSRGDYLFVEVAHTGSGVMPSDVAQIAEALALPYWFWGGVCGAFSVLVLAGGVWVFLNGFPSLRRKKGLAGLRAES